MGWVVDKETGERRYEEESSPSATLLPIDPTNPAALRTLAKSKLIEIIQGSKATTALVPAIKELLDRIDGKAPQSIAMNVTVDPVKKLTDDELAALLALLPTPVVIPPMPKKLDNAT